MEFLEGETLAERLRKGVLPLSEIYKIGIAVSEALAVAHRAGTVHRDLKPANVMLTNMGAKLMDFGLAKPTTGGAPGSSSAPLLSAAATISGPSPWQSADHRVLARRFTAQRFSAQGNWEVGSRLMLFHPHHTPELRFVSDAGHRCGGEIILVENAWNHDRIVAIPLP